MEVVEKKAVIVYHDKCNDGLAAAAVTFEYLCMKLGFPRANIQSIPCNYREKEYQDIYSTIFLLPIKPDVYIVDFCLPLNYMQRLLPWVDKLFIADHHDDEMRKEAYEGLRHIPEVDFIFDPNQSGAGICQRHFFDCENTFIDLVEDRDLWRFKYPESKVLNLALNILPHTVETFHDIYIGDISLSELIGNGHFLKKFNDQIQENIIKGAWDILDHVDRDKIMLCNCPGQFVSEVGNLLCTNDKDVVVACLFNIEPWGMKVSFRSLNGKAVKFAEALNGGGHPNAAGASIHHFNLDELISTIRSIYDSLQ